MCVNVNAIDYVNDRTVTQIACSIGGNVAENAGGVHCLKYGLTVHNLLKIEVQTLDGEALTLGSDALAVPTPPCNRYSRQ